MSFYIEAYPLELCLGERFPGGGPLAFVPIESLIKVMPDPDSEA